MSQAPKGTGSQAGAGSFARAATSASAKTTGKKQTKFKNWVVDNFKDQRKPNYRSGAGAGGGEGCQGGSCDNEGSPKPIKAKPYVGTDIGGGGGNSGGGTRGNGGGNGGGPMANYFRAARSPFKVVTEKGKKKRKK